MPKTFRLKGLPLSKALASRKSCCTEKVGGKYEIL